MKKRTKKLLEGCAAFCVTCKEPTSSFVNTGRRLVPCCWSCQAMGRPTMTSKRWPILSKLRRSEAIRTLVKP